jgi:RimJ/RimL family protein N-acetyltransferase
VVVDDAVVGCTSWYGIEPGNRAVAIGYTYLAPEVRGGDCNLSVKGLMIGHAWAAGFHRIHFDIDVRNQRSQAAVRKLGCQPEGVLRHNKVTWTGFLRDTAIFSLLPGEESDALKAYL